MKIFGLMFTALIMVLPLNVTGVTPVYVGKLVIDTSMYYDFTQVSRPVIWCFSGPNAVSPYVNNNQDVFQAFLRKDSKQFELYSLNGKIGSSLVPLVSDINSIDRIHFSRTMIDDDENWESLVTHYSRVNDSLKWHFSVFDDDGTELLTSTGPAYYGFDGNSTYVIKHQRVSGYISFESWRFRTNIATSTPHSLAKTRAVQPSSMQMFGLSGGDYKVSLSPSSGNQVQFQMFDLMGRCIFSKQLENLKTPVTFTIPESNVPNSPFIAKVKDGNETLYKKQIPVK